MGNRLSAASVATLLLLPTVAVDTALAQAPEQGLVAVGYVVTGLYAAFGDVVCPFADPIRIEIVGGERRCYYVQSPGFQPRRARADGGVPLKRTKERIVWGLSLATLGLGALGHSMEEPGLLHDFTRVFLHVSVILFWGCPTVSTYHLHEQPSLRKAGFAAIGLGVLGMTSPAWFPKAIEPTVTPDGARLDYVLRF